MLSHRYLRIIHEGSTWLTYVWLALYVSKKEKFKQIYKVQIFKKYDIEKVK